MMESSQIVVFKLQGHDFGIDIKKVLEILTFEPIRPVPEVPDYIEGILNVRGTVYTIFSLRKRLSMPEIEDKEHSKIILLHLEDYKVGFLVDNVAEILNVDKTMVEKTPHMGENRQTSCVESIIKREGNMVVVLNVSALISDEKNFYLRGVSDENNSGSDTK